MGSFFKTIAYLIMFYVFSAEVYSQSSVGPAQLRAMQTRKFIGADVAKISDAIETVVQEYGLTTVCSQYKSNPIKWCDANRVAGIYTGGEAIPNISFLIAADTKEKSTFLRVSYTQIPQNQSQSTSIDFYSKFFRKMGDVLFIEAQKIDLQEIN